MHTVRDHPNHQRLLNGGMWGATRHASIHGKVEMLARQYFDHDAYGADLDFLAADIAPLVEREVLAHDSTVRVASWGRGPSLQKGPRTSSTSARSSTRAGGRGATILIRSRAVVAVPGARGVAVPAWVDGDAIAVIDAES